MKSKQIALKSIFMFINRSVMLWFVNWNQFKNHTVFRKYDVCRDEMEPSSSFFSENDVVTWKKQVEKRYFEAENVYAIQ